MDASVIQKSYSNLSCELSDKDVCVFEPQDNTSGPVKPFRYGFIGLTNMSCPIIKNIISRGDPVILWDNRDSVYNESAAGICNVVNPSCVVKMADIIFFCGTGRSEIKELLNTIIGYLNNGTGLVDLVSHEHSLPENFEENLHCQGGRYLQINIIGGEELVKKGLLILAAGGNKSLFNECANMFTPVAKKILYVGSIKLLLKMNVVIKFMHGIVLTGISEGLALAKHAGLPLEVLFKILNLTSSVSHTLLADANVIVENIYSEDLFLCLLKNVHKGLELANELDLTLPVGTVSKEVLKTMNIMNLRKCPHLYSIVDKNKQNLLKTLRTKRKIRRVRFHGKN